MHSTIFKQYNVSEDYWTKSDRDLEIVANRSDAAYLANQELEFDIETGSRNITLEAVRAGSSMRLDC